MSSAPSRVLLTRSSNIEARLYCRRRHVTAGMHVHGTHFTRDLSRVTLLTNR